MEIVTKEDLEIFRIRLLADLKEYINKPEKKQEWLKSSQVRKMLGISAGTLQNLRTTGVLQCSKIGGAFYYKAKQIEELLRGK